jgi:predicted secreted protein
MGTIRELRPIAKLLASLEEENIDFILIGMSAAIIQGVMATTKEQRSYSPRERPVAYRPLKQRERLAKRDVADVRLRLSAPMVLGEP